MIRLVHNRFAGLIFVWIGFSACLLTVISGSSAVVFADDKSDSFNWEGTIAGGNVIEIKGVNGDIKADTSSGIKVEVSAVKHGKRSDASKVKIEVVEHGGGVTICAVYPGSDGEKPNECKPGEQGRMNVRNNDVTVNFTVHVPTGVRLIGRTMNGSIAANAMPADVEGYAVNGSIHISTRGVAQARTVNGSIDVVLGSEIRQQPLAFETVNGNVDVSMPAGINAEVSASTVNGNINTDFPMTVQGHLTRGQIKGVIGSGGARLKMQTINGNIHLRRSS